MTSPKRLIASAVATAIFGVGGVTLVLNSPKDIAKVSSEIQQLEDMAVSDISSATNENLAEIDKAVSDGVSKIEQATSEGVAEIKKEKEKESVSKVESTVPEPKVIPLNVERETGIGVLRITQIKINFEYQSITFSYTTKSKNEMVADTASCTDKNGKKLSLNVFGGSPSGRAKNSDQSETNENEGSGLIGFQGVNDFTAISTVTLTVSFRNDTPATIIIDIPME